jgi:hypothetical protein
MKRPINESFHVCPAGHICCLRANENSRPLQCLIKGEKPADLPVHGTGEVRLGHQPEAAKAFGLDVPPMLLARADEVIE